MTPTHAWFCGSCNATVAAALAGRSRESGNPGTARQGITETVASSRSRADAGPSLLNLNPAAPSQEQETE